MRRIKLPKVPLAGTGLLFLLTLAAATTGCSPGDEPSKQENGVSGNESRDTGPQGFKLSAEPQRVPDVAFTDAAGNPLTFDDFSGRVVLVNIWATWCPPCRKEMPTLDRLQAELGGPDFEVLTLSIDQAGVGVVEDFFAEIDIQHLDIYIDDTGQAAATLNAVGVPTTLLLNREGEEIGRLVGEAEWDTPEMVAFLSNVVQQTQ
ncbi:TlpA disulfide reductase family protein [Aquisalimonas lutea]|uniref:TlpA family protein disulfide reductase n=1 Tax=Aquisalimonas lutea TaxID=1327750 RepID=UPI0025B43D71|nr:TlpA disulfide reductase family protein [Aquisalimonas lutea]MDN3519068.1 TlpA disulfide reductase family protein [Aquisalimonas lutea]